MSDISDEDYDAYHPSKGGRGTPSSSTRGGYSSVRSSQESGRSLHQKSPRTRSSPRTPRYEVTLNPYDLKSPRTPRYHDGPRTPRCDGPRTPRYDGPRTPRYQSYDVLEQPYDVLGQSMESTESVEVCGGRILSKDRSRGAESFFTGYGGPSTRRRGHLHNCKKSEVRTIEQSGS